jgi:CRP/FNR family transcriptional regulator
MRRTEVPTVNHPVPLHEELARGRCRLETIFASSPPHSLKCGELLTAGGPGQGIYRFRAGWACQYRSLTNGWRAIVDVYLPGDVIGLDAVLGTRPVKEISALTAVTIEAILVEDALIELMAERSIAVYVAWLLSKRQQRTARFLSAMSCLDARGRVATMLLEFYTRLQSRGLISGSTYNFPLTQAEIGNYLGLTVVHINRVLRSLRAEEIVVLEKHCVTILDLDRLAIFTQSGARGNASARTRQHALNDAAD